MKEAVIKMIQKYLNEPFRYQDLLKMLDRQKDLLLKVDVIEKVEKCEYNALWDMISDLEKVFVWANSPSLVIKAEISVLRIFNYNYTQRKQNEKTL